MEKFACTLKDMLEEKLSLFQELKFIFQKEKDCIVNVDIDLLWHTVKLKKDLGLKIAALKEQILSLFKEKYASIDMDMETFSLSKLIEKGFVPGKDKSDITKLKSELIVEMEAIKAMASVNNKHVNSYLLVIDDVFSTVMSVTDKEQYTRSGPVANRKKGNCFIRQEV
jgi:flagellar biosynthesis/type III secretory pathway chaperone